MSLGVLNNLSAMYAANNLSNTNNNLSKTLQQLSSGSKINSGADDAAGLALINGLQANATALTQSQTNAQEGVGLLQVADGALSQVTNLLNRAVTLATEVSNGTLNSSQQSAANQEYQSILSEINNIGSTTSYNQQQVFGSSTNIYTGDSSTKGASINALTISSLSSQNLGDTNGSMSYVAANGGAGVFIDLGTTAKGATLGTGTENLVINGATGSGQSTTFTAATASDLVDQINNSGLGLTASFTTGSGAGDASHLTDNGIYIVGKIAGTATATSMGVDDSGVTEATSVDAINAKVATIQYSHGSGSDLSTSDLSSQSDAQAALTQLNTAISAVAAQDGYIGAQINTLNSVSNVMNTQQQNIVAAQNAVQATDYATATSNMSKYQILSQTGIAALAQANSSQQEVLKLLQ
ncbi:MAG: flagellin [Acidobacteriota bacterium]